ncbi:MAG TPA: DUF6152 family protein [Vicinamibacterales bacterium]|jgi:hypothetical protein
MKTKAVLVIGGLGLLLASRPIAAHHSFTAEFDANKPITMTGSVTKFEWTNPHAWIYIDAKDEAGKVSNWGFELAAASGLMRSGWTRFSVKPGDVVTIEGARAKNGSNNASAQTVTLASSGRKLFAGANTQAQ